MKKLVVFSIFIIFAVISSGCNTVKGAAGGLAKDVSTTWEKAKKADDWLQKNAW